MVLINSVGFVVARMRLAVQIVQRIEGKNLGTCLIKLQ